MFGKQRFGHVRRFLCKLHERPESFYLFAAIPTVLSFALFTPPFHGPDEDAHFIRAYSIAQGDILPKATDNGIGSMLPRQVAETINDASYTPNIRGYTSQKYDPFLSITELNDVVSKPRDQIFYDTSATSTYNPVAYLPAVVAILPFSLSDGPPLMAMYAARFATAISTVFIFFLAIKMYPWRKIIPVVAFLLPMLLFQQSVVSIDGISYAVMALFVSLVTQVYAAGFITRRQWLAIGALSVTLCCLKPLMFLFIPLILVVAGRNRRAVIATIATFATCSIVLSAWYVGIGKLYDDVTRPTAITGAAPDEQVTYLKERPLRAIRVAWNTYMTTYGDGQSRGFVGTFGSADTPLPLWVTAVSVVATSVTLVFGKGIRGAPRKISKKYLLLTLMLGAVYFVGINASMYVAYTPVGFNIFYGVQGRYFIPLLLLLPLALVGRVITLSDKDDRRIQAYVLMAVGACLLLSVLTVLQRYYWYTP